MSKAAPIDQRKLASAKLSMLLALGLDAELSKLAVRLGNVMAGKHMHADHGGEAWASIKTYCADLSISSERALREALYALVDGDYLQAVHVAGKMTRYKITARFFTSDKPPPNLSRGHQSTPADSEPGKQETPAQGEPTTQAHSEPDTPAQKAYETPAQGEPTTQAHSEPDTPAQKAYETPAQGEPTITVYKTPGNDHREMITGKGERDAPPSDDLFSSEDAKPKKQPRGKSHSRGKTIATRQSEIDELFDTRFWSIWPEKVAKEPARTAFRKCYREIDAIVEGVHRYIATKPPDRNWMHPATFLNQRRWEDQPAQPSNGVTVGVGNAPRQRMGALEIIARRRGLV